MEEFEVWLSVLLIVLEVIKTTIDLIRTLKKKKE